MPCSSCYGCTVFLPGSCPQVCCAGFQMHESSIARRPSCLSCTQTNTVNEACVRSAECGIRFARLVAVKNIFPHRFLGNPASFSIQRAMSAIVRPSRSDTPFCGVFVAANSWVMPVSRQYVSKYPADYSPSPSVRRRSMRRPPRIKTVWTNCFSVLTTSAFSIIMNTSFHLMCWSVDLLTQRTPPCAGGDTGARRSVYTS